MRRLCIVFTLCLFSTQAFSDGDFFPAQITCKLDQKVDTETNLLTGEPTSYRRRNLASIPFRIIMNLISQAETHAVYSVSYFLEGGDTPSPFIAFWTKDKSAIEFNDMCRNADPCYEKSMFYIVESGLLVNPSNLIELEGMQLTTSYEELKCI